MGITDIMVRLVAFFIYLSIGITLLEFTIVKAIESYRRAMAVIRNEKEPEPVETVAGSKF